LNPSNIISYARFPVCTAGLMSLEKEGIQNDEMKYALFEAKEMNFQSE
jgi:hypothetical protein